MSNTDSNFNLVLGAAELRWLEAADFVRMMCKAPISFWKHLLMPDLSDLPNLSVVDDFLQLVCLSS